MDARTAAEKARDQVESAYDKADRLQDNGGVSSAISARMDADRLAADWAVTYPGASAARKAAVEASEASRRLKSLPHPQQRTPSDGNADDGTKNHETKYRSRGGGNRPNNGQPGGCPAASFAAPQTPIN